MNLREYLTATRTPVVAFARQLGVHPQAVHRYLTGERTPRKNILKQIITLTAGQVTADSFFGNRLPDSLIHQPADTACDATHTAEPRAA